MRRFRSNARSADSKISTRTGFISRGYSGGEIDALDLGAYLSDLARTLLSIQACDGAIRLQIAVESVLAKPKVAIPVGLILNEFITNSMKYSFQDGTGVVGAELLAANGDVILRFWDDGKGLPEPPNDGRGTGINLINALAKQINSKVTWSSEGGTTVILTFRT